MVFKIDFRRRKLKWVFRFIRSKTFTLNGAMVSVRKFSTHKLLSGGHFSCWPFPLICQVPCILVGGLICSMNTVKHLDLL